jgi:hypothetical protein
MSAKEQHAQRYGSNCSHVGARLLGRREARMERIACLHVEAIEML